MMRIIFHSMSKNLALWEKREMQKNRNRWKATSKHRARQKQAKCIHITQWTVNSTAPKKCKKLEHLDGFCCIAVAPVADYYYIYMYVGAHSFFLWYCRSFSLRFDAVRSWRHFLHIYTTQNAAIIFVYYYKKSGIFWMAKKRKTSSSKRTHTYTHNEWILVRGHI